MTPDEAAEARVAEPGQLPDEARGAAPGRGRLTGRRILIVGGGQQDHGLEDPPIGNGRTTSVLCAREGTRVAVADIDEASAEATADLVRGEGGEATTIAADAADEDGVATMFTSAPQALGGLAGLVINVGTAGGWHVEGNTV